MKGQKTACLQNFVRASAGLTFLGTSENHETFSRKQLHGHGDGTMHLWHLFKEECGMLLGAGDDTCAVTEHASFSIDWNTEASKSVARVHDLFSAQSRSHKCRAAWLLRFQRFLAICRASWQG